jgi:DNA repair protein RecO (recombination protein O)
MKGPGLTTEGIVLRLVNYGETDRIVGFLTPDHGKLSAFAPSARTSSKRFGGALDFFSRLTAEVRPPKDVHGNLWRLQRVELLETHLELRSDLRRLAQASYLSDCLWNLLGDGDPHPELYAWFLRALERLSTEQVSVATDLRFELEMLSLCGFAPHWEQCLECGARPTEERVFFSFHRGGIICGRCRKVGEGRWIDARSIAMVRNGDTLPVSTAASLRQVLNSFVSHTLGREPKSQKFREEVFCG